MAGHTGDIAGFVLASPPEDLLPPRVTLEADIILIRGVQDRLLAEAEVVGRVRLILHVLASWPVTGLTAAGLNLALGELCPQKLPVQGVFHLLELVLVAPLARLTPHKGRPGDCRSRSLGLDAQDQHRNR